LREILDAVFYVVRGGCTWRLLPHDFPPWKSVYHYFRLWRIETVLGSGCTRHYAGGGRGYTSAETRSPARWHRRQPEREDHRHRRRRAWLRPGQEGEGHSKRHLLVDTQGLVLKAKVHAANVFERDGIKPLMELVEDRFPRLSHLWLDAGYNGKGKGKDWAEKFLGLSVEVVRPPRRWVWFPEGQEPPPWLGFTVLPRRWVVERTFSWIDQNRRLSKDYEKLTATSEAFIYVAMSRLLVKRLARS
jgi:putative transposase